jgi:hypothetical protein
MWNNPPQGTPQTGYNYGQPGQPPYSANPYPPQPTHFAPPTPGYADPNQPLLPPGFEQNGYGVNPTPDPYGGYNPSNLYSQQTTQNPYLQTTPYQPTQQNQYSNQNAQFNLPYVDNTNSTQTYSGYNPSGSGFMHPSLPLPSPGPASPRGPAPPLFQANPYQAAQSSGFGAYPTTNNYYNDGMRIAPMDPSFNPFDSLGPCFNANDGMERYGFYTPGIQSNQISTNTQWESASQLPANWPSNLNLPEDPFMEGGTNIFEVLGQPSNVKIDQTLPDMFLTGLINVDSNAPGLREKDPMPLVQDNHHDIVGDNRQWNNWVIPTFEPTRAVAVHDENPNNTMGEKMTHAAPVKNSQANNFSTKKLQEAIRKCQSSHSAHLDSEFPARIESIWGFGEDPSYSKADLQRLAWCRPGDIFKGRPYGVIVGDVDPNDIKQGMLGDCYLLAALASIAEFPERMKRIFSDTNKSSIGAYSVHLCLTGVWEEVLLDDQFPCQPYSKTPAFTSTKTDEIWVMLVEKAWAKVHGGFLNINGGLIREALHDLTGAPAITYFTREGKPEEHWNNIIDGDSRNYIMAAGTDDISGTGNDAFNDRIGLSGNHAYSLLAAYEIVNDRGNKRALRQGEPSNPSNERIVKMRNPWGEKEWKGDWADGSGKWTPQLRNELKAKTEEDGIFFMPFADFLKYYYDYQICYYHDDYQYSPLKIKSGPSKPTVLEFQINRGGEYFFSINQINKRMFREVDRYTYSPLSLIVVAIDQYNNSKYIGGVSKSDKEMWFKGRCEPGRYIAYITTPWKRNVNEFGFAAYGPEFLQLRPLSESEMPKGFLEKCMIQKASKDRVGFNNYAAQGEPKISYKFENGTDNFGYFFFDNQSESTNLTATIEFTEMQDTEVLEPYSGRKPVVSVGPKEQKILMYKMNGDKAKVSFRLAASFKKNISNITESAKKLGKKCVRMKQGKDVGIAVYVLYHEDGLVYYYQNNSSNQTLMEDLKFDLSNCAIEGMGASQAARVRLVPHSTYLLNIKRTVAGRAFTANLASGTFLIQ